MEYRKRKSRRKEPPENGGMLLRAVILIAVFGASLYLILGTNVGERIKNGYAISLIESCRGKSSSPSPTPILLPEATETPAPTASPTGETATVKLPGIEINMIEMGVYSDAALCEAKAEQLKSMGAAGYIFNDGGSLRLIVSAYSDKSAAQSVADRLNSEGWECTVHSVSCGAAELMITASPERLVPIRTAFSMASETIAALDELALDFDASARTTEYGETVLGEILANMRESYRGIEPSSEHNAMLKLLCSYYSDLIEMASSSSASVSDRTAYSSFLKALRVEASLRYVLLLGELGGES